MLTEFQLHQTYAEGAVDGWGVPVSVGSTFSIHTQFAINEVDAQKICHIPGVVRAGTVNKYCLQVRTGRMFDTNTVAAKVRVAIETRFKRKKRFLRCNQVNTKHCDG